MAGAACAEPVGGAHGAGGARERARGGGGLGIFSQACPANAGDAARRVPTASTAGARNRLTATKTRLSIDVSFGRQGWRRNDGGESTGDASGKPTESGDKAGAEAEPADGNGLGALGRARGHRDAHLSPPLWRRPGNLAWGLPPSLLLAAPLPRSRDGLRGAPTQDAPWPPSPRPPPLGAPPVYLLRTSTARPRWQRFAPTARPISRSFTASRRRRTAEGR